ncbi:MAG TPA: HHL1-like protein [Halomicronema sp.]
MASSKGFGKVEPAKKVTKGAGKRAEAGKKYEEMKADGLPEFSVFVRVKDKKNWFPIGSLAVNRSTMINRAIFENEDDLLQGAFRLFPVLKKSQNNLEYGYRLKGSEYADEPIEVAVKPVPGAGGLIQNAVDNLKSAFTGILKKK